MAKSLWGNIDAEKTISTPLSIMKEQASELSKVTNGLLYGEVSTGQVNIHGRGQGLLHRLFVVAPALNNYQIEIVRVVHSIALYPATVVSSLDEDANEVNTAQELETMLGTILGGKEVHNIIYGLLAQSRS